MEHKNYEKDLQHIRQMMEKSSRFISLNGISGVFAGLYALAGALYVYYILGIEKLDYSHSSGSYLQKESMQQLIAVALMVMLAAVATAAYFTMRKSREHRLKIWDMTTKNLLYHFAVPLVVGGLFCTALILNGQHVWLSPATLVFYGLALFSAGNYTFSDIKYLGLSEIALGVVSLFFLGYGLLFWTVGFGVMHIVYGLIMHKKYK